MADIFISFSDDDKDVAVAIRNVLLEAFKYSKTVFSTADTWQLIPGEDWLKKIKSELAEAKVVLLLLSKKSIKKPWLNFEAGAAWLTEKPMIPVCFRGLHKGKMPEPYSGIHGVNIPGDLHDLVSAVFTHLDPMDPGTVFRVPLITSNTRAYQVVAAAIAGKLLLTPPPGGDDWFTSTTPMPPFSLADLMTKSTIPFPTPEPPPGAKKQKP